MKIKHSGVMRQNARKYRYLWLAVTALWAIFIVSNSMKPASVSGAESQSVLSFVTSVPLLSQMGITEHFIRKAAHFLEYALFGMLTARTGGDFAPMKCRERHLLSGFSLLFLPLCDETVQLFTDGRAGMISDVWLDFAGGSCGYLLVMLIACLFARSVKKKN